MNKKGQAAMEFLMTYGWAILVVLVAIGALAYFGVLSPDKFLPEKCVISSGSGLFCANFNVATASDDIVLLIKNSLSDPVTITGGGSTLGTLCTQDAGDVAIAADADASVTFSCAGGIASGDKIKEDVSISYTVGTFAKTTSGSLIAKAP
ncbi:MAG: hypothetical protein U9O94_01060 [Nanoarchaeota archaeon]|nr:hypothetical protein [Nanoarchaeota archaeon]